MITRERIDELLFFSPRTGKFIRLKASDGKKFPGHLIEGTVNKHGYLQFSVDGTVYLYHKIVWYYCGGNYNDVLLCIDGDKTNTKVNNYKLRY